ncbi:hypothetical protein R1sor_014957 [Riccia sorocarpa]|uniref:Uncharacterized protein n=1 Tax=Riccia sorocarpa TaxID=122646 RepID=A0ABD3HB64_9MARC
MQTAVNVEVNYLQGFKVSPEGVENMRGYMEYNWNVDIIRAMEVITHYLKSIPVHGDGLDVVVLCVDDIVLLNLSSLPLEAIAGSTPPLGSHFVFIGNMTAEGFDKVAIHKNSHGDYHCPVLHKAFTEFTHIVTIKTTGNVFSYEDPNKLESSPGGF